MNEFSMDELLQEWSIFKSDPYLRLTLFEFLTMTQENNYPSQDARIIFDLIQGVLKREFQDLIYIKDTVILTEMGKQLRSKNEHIAKNFYASTRKSRFKGRYYISNGPICSDYIDKFISLWALEILKVQK